MQLEYVNIIFNGISAVGTFFGFIIALKTLKQTQKIQEEGIKRQRKQATLDAYNLLQKEVLDRINELSPSKIREITDDTTSVEYKELGGYLAKIEHFCVGLEKGIYDYETFIAMAQGYFDSEKGILKPRLLPILNKKLEHSDKDYYYNIHAVWKHMDEMNK